MSALTAHAAADLLNSQFPVTATVDNQGKVHVRLYRANSDSGNRPGRIRRALTAAGFRIDHFTEDRNGDVNFRVRRH